MQNVKSFHIRWSDLDANRHVANLSYFSFTVECRVAFLAEHGFGQDKLMEHNLGPVVLSEQMSYLRELLPGETVYVDIELLGYSEDKHFYKFSHTLFNSQGKMSAYSELLFAWIDLTTRKIVVPPPHLLDLLEKMPHNERFAILGKGDIRNPNIPRKTLPINNV